MPRGKLPEWVTDLWQLLRGSPNYRFAALLVRIGAGLVAVPPIALVLDLVLDIALPRPEGWMEIVLALAPIGVGLILIATGVVLFWKKGQVQPLKECTAIRVLEGQTFRSAVDAVMKGEEKALIFENFSTEELAAPLKGQSLSHGSCVEVVKALGALAKSGTFPPYEAIEEGAHFIVRRKV